MDISEFPANFNPRDNMALEDGYGGFEKSVGTKSKKDVDYTEDITEYEYTAVAAFFEAIMSVADLVADCPRGVFNRDGTRVIYQPDDTSQPNMFAKRLGKGGSLDGFNTTEETIRQAIIEWYLRGGVVWYRSGDYLRLAHLYVDPDSRDSESRFIRRSEVQLVPLFRQSGDAKIITVDAKNMRYWRFPSISRISHGLREGLARVPGATVLYNNLGTDPEGFHNYWDYVQGFRMGEPVTAGMFTLFENSARLDKLLKRELRKGPDSNIWITLSSNNQGPTERDNYEDHLDEVSKKIGPKTINRDSTAQMIGDNWEQKAKGFAVLRDIIVSEIGRLTIYPLRLVGIETGQGASETNENWELLINRNIRVRSRSLDTIFTGLAFINEGPYIQSAPGVHILRSSAAFERVMKVLERTNKTNLLSDELIKDALGIF